MAIKTILIILIAAITNGCLGQYPKLRLDSNGKVINANRYEQPQLDNYKVDTIYTGQPLYILIQFDSAKYYYNKHSFYDNKMHKELTRINRYKNPTLTKELLRYQDSSLYFKTLLEKLKK